MRVVVNGLAALKPKTGVGHHVANLVAGLRDHCPDVDPVLYPGDLLSGVIARLNRPAAGPRTTSSLRGGTRTAAVGWVKAAAKAGSGLHFAAYTRAFRFDLYHEPNFVPFRSHLPTIVTVHDLSVLRFPQWHPADRVRMHEQHFLDGLRRAAHVVTVSEAVRREVIADAGVPADRVTAVHNGVGASFRLTSPERVAETRTRLGLPKAYFLCVGTIEPRKNVGTVMRAFADLPAEVRGACPLVLVGPWGWKSEAERAYFDGPGAAAGVRHLGYVSDLDLPAVYAGAAALLYPSYYEGFGLPPVEMMACGGAVLASTADAVREVCGDRAELIDPNDIPGWRTAMHRLATDAEYRDGLRRGGVEHAARFTWQRAAEETAAIYRHVQGLRLPRRGLDRPVTQR